MRTRFDVDWIKPPRLGSSSPRSISSSISRSLKIPSSLSISSKEAKSANPSKVTILFLANSLLLAYLASERMQQEPTSLLDTSTAVEQSEVTTEIATPENDDGDEYEGQDQGIPDLPVE